MAGEKNKGRSKFGREMRGYLEAFLIAALFLRFANTFVLQTFYIPSSSMEDTLLVGDHLFVNRYIYGATATDLERWLLPARQVRRGDIVVFRSPEEPELDVIKRCVAVEGDVVEMLDKQLYINDERVDDGGYAVHKDPRLFPKNNARLPEQWRQRDSFGPVTVPPDHYFCMGDNRDYSYDSRYWGPLPAHMVKGRALFIYWSYGGRTSDGTWHGAGDKVRQILSTMASFFSKTRWERSLQLIR